MMNKTEIRQENLYNEMESKKANEAGIYDDVVRKSTAPATKQTIWGKQRNEKKRPASTGPAHSCQANQILVDLLPDILWCDIVMMQRGIPMILCKLDCLSSCESAMLTHAIKSVRVCQEP